MRELKMTTKKMDKYGMELFEKYGRLTEEEKQSSPEAAALIVEMMPYLPQDVQDEMHEMAVKMGLIPEKPSGYLEDGTPVYNIEDVAKSLGFSPEEAVKQSEIINQATGGKYAIDPSKVHRVQ